MTIKSRTTKKEWVLTEAQWQVMVDRGYAGGWEIIPDKKPATAPAESVRAAKAAQRHDAPNAADEPPTE